MLHFENLGFNLLTPLNYRFIIYPNFLVIARCTYSVTIRIPPIHKLIIFPNTFHKKFQSLQPITLHTQVEHTLPTTGEDDSSGLGSESDELDQHPKSSLNSRKMQMSHAKTIRHQTHVWVNHNQVFHYFPRTLLMLPIG